MHPDLSSHLHTPECNELITQLLECHKNHNFLRYFGHCTHLDNVMLKCLKRERLTRRAANAAKAVEKNKQVRERMRELYN